ncbi:MAG: hypothetical protein IJC19_01785 [Clostridia bacterium]|nr:hypothetical protein [Clostridia bacterium]
MKRILVASVLAIALIFSLVLSAGAVSVNEVFAYSDPNWGKGNNVTADGLWRYEWFARETQTFAAMDWNASGSHYESQFTTAAASDTHWYCRIRSNGTNLHPGAQADAVMTFVCPESGTVELSVNLQRQYDPNPNGNTVRVMLNDTIVPINGQEEHKLESKSAFSLAVTAEVQKGDLLRLMLGSQGNSSSDGVNFSGLKVKYLSGANLEPEKPSFTITCVGDSITEGYGTTGGFKGVNAFPYVLEGLLDKTGLADFTVVNCGKSATTALVKGDRPYKQSAEYATSLKSNPNVVIICLGANDSKTANWNAAQYKADYKALISEYINLPSKPTVYLFYTTYVADQSKTGCRRTVIQNEIMPIQDEIAAELGLKIIDLNTLTKSNSTKYTDGVHPDDTLQAMMAEYIFNAFCSEGVAGLTAANATEKVEMIEPSEETVSTDTSSASTSTKTNTVTDTDSGDSSTDTVTDSESASTDTVTDSESASTDTVTDSESASTDTVTDSENSVSESETNTDGKTEDTSTEVSEATDSIGSDDAAQGGGWILWVVIGGVALVAVGAVLFFLLWKKKSR